MHKHRVTYREVYFFHLDLLDLLMASWRRAISVWYDWLFFSCSVSIMFNLARSLFISSSCDGSSEIGDGFINGDRGGRPLPPVTDAVGCGLVELRLALDAVGEIRWLRRSSSSCFVNRLTLWIRQSSELKFTWILAQLPWLAPVQSFPFAVAWVGA